MGGFCGVTSKRDCVLDVFFAVDYHSHLGTRRAGMIFHDEEGFQRQIHSIENTPFRTRFEDDLAKFHGNCGIGCISDTDPQPLLVRSHLGVFAITTIGCINNADELVDEYFSKGDRQFMAMSSGKVNSTELVAALINQREDFVAGIKFAQEVVDGSLTLLIMTDDEHIIAARDKMGRLPILIGKNDDGYCASFESFAYEKLGYVTDYELGPAEIVDITCDGYRTLSEPGDDMKICAFLWVYYGYPNSKYEGENVEVVRNRNGAIMARDEKTRGILPDVDSVAGVPRFGCRARHRLLQRIRLALRTSVHQVHAHLATLVHAAGPVHPQPCRQDEARSRTRAHRGQEAALRRRFDRARHPAARDG